MAHLLQGVLGGDAPVHDPDALGLAVLRLDFFQKPSERGFVAGVAGHHFVGQREAFGTQDHGDDDLTAIGTLVAAVAALGFGRLFHLALEIGAGQIVEQQVVSGAKEVFPPRLQMREKGRPMRVQVVEAFVEPVLGGHGEIFLQQLIHRAGEKPTTVQMPLAAGSDQLADAEQFEHFVPRHLDLPLGQTLTPEGTQVEFIPQTASQPAVAENARTLQG